MEWKQKKKENSAQPHRHSVAVVDLFSIGVPFHLKLELGTFSINPFHQLSLVS